MARAGASVGAGDADAAASSVLGDATSAEDASLAGAPLDRLLLNAGIYGPAAQDVATASEAEIGHLFLSNAVAPLRLARALAPRLAGGRKRKA